MNQFRCLGKNKDGTRCKIKFLTSSYSTILTCHKHRDQNVTFQYGEIDIGGIKDVAGLIVSYIDDPLTYKSFASVCRSTAKACDKHQLQKKVEFSTLETYHGFTYRRLPNGMLINDDGTYK